MDRKKLGILGGTFDPIHLGHLLTVECIRKELGLEGVLFIPAYVAPHKIGEEFAPVTDRYHMTELAVSEYPFFSVSDIEIRRAGVSYTYDTLLALKAEYGSEYDLYFIIGADSAVELKTWHRIAELMQLCYFVAAARPGFEPHKAELKESFGEMAEKKILWVHTPEIDISSTEIRERVRNHKSVKNLVPEEVAEYIRQKDLYLE